MSTSFIFQVMSMAVQRGNVQCVQGTYGESAFEELDEIFYTALYNQIIFFKQKTHFDLSSFLM